MRDVSSDGSHRIWVNGRIASVHCLLFTVAPDAHLATVACSSLELFIADYITKLVTKLSINSPILQ